MKYEVTVGIKGEGYSQRTIPVTASSPPHAQILAVNAYKRLIEIVEVKEVPQ